MASRIFVSYNFADREVAYTVKSFAQRCNGTVEGRFVFVENDVSAHGPRAIDDEINKVMNACDAAVFVIGNNNHNSPWIDREAKLAISKNLRIILTRLPETTGSCPAALADPRFPNVRWSSAALAIELNPFHR